jgi:hypothetical protein
MSRFQELAEPSAGISDPIECFTGAGQNGLLGDGDVAAQRSRVARGDLSGGVSVRKPASAHLHVMRPLACGWSAPQTAKLRQTRRNRRPARGPPTAAAEPVPAAGRSRVTRRRHSDRWSGPHHSGSRCPRRRSSEARCRRMNRAAIEGRAGPRDALLTRDVVRVRAVQRFDFLLPVTQPVQPSTEPAPGAPPGLARPSHRNPPHFGWTNHLHRQ